MANYPHELPQDSVCQSHTGHMTGLWFLSALPLRLHTNERMNIYIYIYIVSWLVNVYLRIFLIRQRLLEMYYASLSTYSSFLYVNKISPFRLLPVQACDINSFLIFLS